MQNENIIEKFVDAFVYYEKEFDKIAIIKVPRLMVFHHYAIIIITSYIEAFFSTGFMVPVISVLITQYLVISRERKIRTIEICIDKEVSFYEENISDIDRSLIFDQTKSEVFEIGFLYSRIILVLKSLALIFLVHYATIGYNIS